MKIKDKINRLIIYIEESISSALKQMDTTGSKLLMVFDKDDFISLLSIGDIQRAILNNTSLQTKVMDILRSEIVVAKTSDSVELLKKEMIKNRTELMPIVDEQGALADVLFWEDIFSDTKFPKNKFDLPIVIMAGGKGTRLKPLTNVIPKPLIPIGEKTIIEEIMDRFMNVGSSTFYISVNYKADTIKHYFKQLNSKEYKINYFEENKPLGTAGSLHLIKDKIKSTFFVSNCDIIINEDYAEILKYHRANKNELTIVSALKQISIPYGTIETKKDGILTQLIEKPNLSFQINSGLYILEPHLLDRIPKNQFFHITKLIDDIMKRGGQVGVFPVSEGSWVDIGEWKEYLNVINKFDNNDKI